jgi:magnesium chelatase subunit H
MLERLRSLNPHSARTLVGRLLEASGRGFWRAEQPVLDRLQDAFSGLEDQLEGVTR